MGESLLESNLKTEIPTNRLTDVSKFLPLFTCVWGNVSKEKFLPWSIKGCHLPQSCMVKGFL